MCRAKTPKVERSAPPPMIMPETTDDNVRRKASRERARNASAFGRQSTYLNGNVGGPTMQAKTLLGT